jgi:hypothetical protein
MLAAALLAVPVHASGSAPSAAPEVTLGAGGPASETAFGAFYNGTPCGVLASEYGNVTGLNYSSNYTLIFAKICRTSQFVSLYDEGLNASGIFVIGWGGQIGAVPSISFSLYRSGPCTNASFGPGITQCVFQADWIGYLSNNSYSGPYLREYPLTNSGGPILAPVSAPAGSYPALLAVAAGVAVGAVISLTVVTARRRSELRDTLLRDDRDESGAPAERERPSRPPPKEPNNTLDDIF